MSVLPWSVLGLDDSFSCAAIQLRIAGAGYLDQLEHGRVTKPETINSRTYRGERGGLFDHEIFGALADGYDDFADLQAKAQAELAARPADDEPTPPHPRRDRFGRIDLCEPLVHPLLLLRGASWLERATNLKLETLREVIQRDRHVVVEAPGRESVSTISADELGETSEAELERLGLESGGVAIRELLRRNGHAIDPLIRAVHVIPVQLRPIIPIASGRRDRFASDDLNDLYRRVVNRNNRLARLHELNAPEIIVRNERAQLQYAVDQLFDNGASMTVVTGPGQRPLASLWDLAGGEALGERLRGLDRWVAERGYAALERGLPGALFRTWRAIQAMGLELGEP